MNDLISRQALCEYALNQKDKSITPNDIMRFPSAQPEPRWIPCSEEIPKKTGYYICTCHDGVCYRTSVLKWSTGWVLTGARSYWKVKAWMPLPEPYQKGADT